jgi:hypothetical protein
MPGQSLREVNPVFLDKKLGENQCSRKTGGLHQSGIVTQAPNLMWGTDGARVLTMEEGWGWIFVAIEHWNAECVGWLSANRKPAMSALEPVSQGLKACVGAVAADAGARLCVWTTASSICRITPRASSSTGVSAPVSPLSNHHRPTAWPNASSGPLRSRSSAAGCSRISKR